MKCPSFKDEFELPTQRRTRDPFPLSWRIAQKRARSSPPGNRFPPRKFACPAKTEQRTWLVPLTIPSRAKHARPRLSRPCRPSRSMRKRLLNPTPSAAFLNRIRENSHSACSQAGVRDRRFAALLEKCQRFVPPTHRAMIFPSDAPSLVL